MVCFQDVRLQKCWQGSWLALFLCIFFIVIGFNEIYASWWSAWQKDEYSHGPIIPFLAALIGWHRVAERKPSMKGDAAGIFVLLVGFVLFALSILSAFEALARLGFVIAILGAFWANLGRSFAKALAPSFIYLLFAVPLPSYAYVSLSSNMQMISSTLGVWFLDLLNISVYQEGNIIDLGTYKLQVVEACSGLRYLFPLLSFSFLIALMFKDKAWKRGIVFLSAVPLAILLNALRIALIGITVNLWGPSMAEGVLHDFEGWVVFCICVFLLFCETKFLASVGKSRGVLRFDYLGIPPKMEVVAPSLSRQNFLIIGLCAAFVAIIVAGKFDRKLEIMPERPSFSSFPLQIDGWRGEQKALSQDELSMLQLTDYLLADYVLDNNDSINLYMAYYASQSTGAAIHSPSNCLPGSGWEIVERTIVPIDIAHQTFPVTRTFIRKGESATLVYYWFQGRGRISNEQYEAKWYILVDSIRLHRTNGALIRLTTPVFRGEKIEDADKRLQNFLSKAYPKINPYIP